MCLLDTSTYHYKSHRPGQAGLELRIREICQTRVRYGYRRVHIQLRRESWCHGQNKTRRIYRELGLQLRNKHLSAASRQSCGRIVGPPAARTRPGRWTLCMTSSPRAPHVDDRRYISHASPRRWSRVSHSAALMLWRCSKDSAGKWASRRRSGSRHRICITRFGSVGLSARRDIGLLPDQASPPNSRFRAECLNAHWFRSLADVHKKLENWRKYYNEERPHGAIGDVDLCC